MATNLMNGLSKTSRTAATLARLTGWSLSANQKKTMLDMWDPSHQHKVIVPYGSVNAHRAESILRQVIRYTPAPALAGVLYGEEDMREDTDAAQLVTTLGPVLISTILDTAESWDDIPEDIRKRFVPADHAVRHLPGGPDYRPEPVPEVEPVVDAETGDFYTETAWTQTTLADIVMRTYTDDSVEYLCMEHDPPLVFGSIPSVRGHLGAHTKPEHVRAHSRKSEPEPEVIPEPGPEDYMCPECAAEGISRGYARVQGLGAHRWRSHGVRGTSREAGRLAVKKALPPDPARMTGQQIATRIHGEPVARVHWAARETGKEGQPGKMYESAAVDLVTYTDGHIGYVCQHCEEFASDNPRAVSAHSAQQHPGESEQKGQPHFTVPVYEESGIKRTQRDTRLQHVITEALDTIADWQAMTATEVGVAVADYIAENRPDRVPTQPLTDAEVLERIVRLVDRGQYASLQEAITNMSGQIRDLSEVVDADSEKINELQHDRDEALRRVNTLIAERTALHDMLGQVPS